MKVELVLAVFKNPSALSALDMVDRVREAEGVAA
jgi:hypothetical protein